MSKQYVSSAIEIERQCVQPKCAITKHVVMVLGKTVIEQGGEPCRVCGGIHAIYDTYETEDEVRKAFASPSKDDAFSFRLKALLPSVFPEKPKSKPVATKAVTLFPRKRK